MNRLPPAIYALLISIFVAALSSCQSKTDEKNEETGQETSALPALGNEALTQLYAAAERADIIFYNLPISVDQDEASSAKNSVLYVSPTVQKFNPSCKALGRITWMSKGSIYKEADIYVDPGCQYFVFIENNQPVAINAMSESGVKFFNNVIEQVKQRAK